MSNLSKREKILLIILIICAFCYLYYNYVATPLIDKYNNEKTVFEYNKTKLNNLIETKNNIDNIRKQSDEINIEIENLKSVIPDTKKIPQIIVDIKSMTNASGCSIISMSFHDVSNSNTNEQNSGLYMQNNNSTKQNNNGVLTSIPISYEIKGSYDSIISLLNKLENSSRKMIIDKLSVSKTGEPGILSVNMTINCYYLNKNQESNIVDYPFINNTTGKYYIFD